MKAMAVAVPLLIVTNALAERAAASVRGLLAQTPGAPVEGPLVSVVVPTLNEERFLPFLLQSIRSQSYHPIEVIVADSSTDATPEIARDMGAHVITVPDLNVSLARNEGARAAQGEVLLFCDADCILAPDYVQRMVELLEAGATLAHGSQCVYDSAVHNFLSSAWRSLKPRTWTTGRGVAIRRADFLAIGGYDVSCDPTKGCREDLRLGRDVEAAFGRGSIALDRNAMVATSARRPLGMPGLVWRERGWRDGVIPAEAEL